MQEERQCQGWAAEDRLAEVVEDTGGEAVEDRPAEVEGVSFLSSESKQVVAEI